MVFQGRAYCGAWQWKVDGAGQRRLKRTPRRKKEGVQKGTDLHEKGGKPPDEAFGKRKTPDSTRYGIPRVGG